MTRSWALSTTKGRSISLGRGDLKVDADNQLVLGSGKLVASDAGDPIILPPNQIISISEEGMVYALDPAQEVAEQVEVGQIMLRDASNRNLVKLENGLCSRSKVCL